MAKFEVFLKSGKNLQRLKIDSTAQSEKKEKCRDQDSNLGYCGHNAMY